MELIPGGKKKNHKKGFAARAKVKRREEAEARASAYAKIPAATKLAQAGAKEKAKIYARDVKGEP